MPEVFDSLRSDVLDHYLRIGPRVSFYFAKTQTMAEYATFNAFLQSIPRMVFDTALGLDHDRDFIWFRFGEIRRFLEGYPESDEASTFLDEGLANWNTLNVLLQARDPEARRQEYASFEEEWATQVPPELIRRFASVAFQRLNEMEEALLRWAETHHLAVGWILENTRETLFTGAFSDAPSFFPATNRWDFTIREWTLPEVYSLPHREPIMIKVPFDYRPVAERRREFRDRIEGAFWEQVNQAIDRLERRYVEAGYQEATKIKLQRHHFVWSALALIKRYSAEKILDVWAEQHGGKEPPHPTTVIRGVASAAEAVGIASPLRMSSGGMKKQEP